MHRRHRRRIEIEIKRDVMEDGDERVGFLFQTGRIQALMQALAEAFGQTGVGAQPAFCGGMGQGKMQPQEITATLLRVGEQVQGRGEIDEDWRLPGRETIAPDQAIAVRALSGIKGFHAGPARVIETG